MKKFKFRLQRVLDYKQIVKGEKKRVLLEKNRNVELARTRLEHLENEELLNRFEQNQILDAARVLMRGDYAQRLKREIEWQRVAILKAQEEAELALAEYIEAAKDEKALITLKDKRLFEYKAEAEAEERKFLDEFTIRRGNSFKEEENKVSLEMRNGSI